MYFLLYGTALVHRSFFLTWISATHLVALSASYLAHGQPIVYIASKVGLLKNDIALCPSKNLSKASDCPHNKVQSPRHGVPTFLLSSLSRVLTHTALRN